MSLDRRRFLGVTAGAIACGVLAGCGASLSARRAAPPLDLAAFRAERRYVATPQGRIAYVERGRGEVVLFLHGFPLNGFQWRGAIERLSPQRRCIAPDFLGMGATEVAASGDCHPETQVAMLLELLDALRIERADVIANDSGGAVAQLLVAHHPQRVRSLLLTNGDTEIDSPPAALLPVIELAKRGEFVDAWLGRWHADRALARSPEGIGGMCYADPAHPTDEAIEAYFGPLLATPRSKAMAHAYAIALERNALAGIGPALKRCLVPTRIVWGMADTIFSPESPDFLDRAFGRSMGVRRLADRKLFWPEEMPEVIAEEAENLWRAAAAEWRA